MKNEKYVQDSGKRCRTVMTIAQNKTLMEYFEVNPFPSAEIRDEISQILNMKSRTIQVWFQNQRQKAKNRPESISGKRMQHIEEDTSHKSGGFGRLQVLASVALKEIRERESMNKNSGKY